MAEAAAQGRRAQTAQGEARRRGRSRRASARCARPRPNAELIVDANEAWRPDNLGRQPRRLRRGRRHAGRAAAAGERRRGARRSRAADSGLRRRKRARPRLARRARRQIRRREHQARQDRRPDRGARDGARGRAARLRAHGRLHGGDLARRWRPRCWSRNARAWSISTARSCSRATATACAMREAWSIRRRRRCGGKRLRKRSGYHNMRTPSVWNTGSAVTSATSSICAWAANMRSNGSRCAPGSRPAK